MPADSRARSFFDRLASDAGKARSALDFAKLCGAAMLVARSFLPTASIALGLCGLAYFAYLGDPIVTRWYRLLTADGFIVLKQIERAKTLPAPNIAFVGDSSCLMDIHVPRLRELLQDGSVESFCSLAFLGPAGYAYILDSMIERKATPRALVIAMHPVGFRRSPEFEVWPAAVRQGGLSYVGHDPGFPAAALDHARFRWLAPVLYKPLPGSYGLYYGSAAALVDEIGENHGSAVDPNAGLGRDSRPGAKDMIHIAQSYATNAGFENALDTLAATLARMDRSRVFLVISPIPASAFTPESVDQREEAARRIAQRLGLPAGNVLASPESAPDSDFSTATHLNRWGRITFTETLAGLLQSAIARTGAP